MSKLFGQDPQIIGNKALIGKWEMGFHRTKKAFALE